MLAEESGRSLLDHLAQAAQQGDAPVIVLAWLRVDDALGHPPAVWVDPKTDMGLDKGCNAIRAPVDEAPGLGSFYYLCRGKPDEPSPC